eukprot:SAG31_NODE_43331_length_267_cov_1.160714_1_plen_51_part_01
MLVLCPGEGGESAGGSVFGLSAVSEPGRSCPTELLVLTCVRVTNSTARSYL